MCKDQKDEYLTQNIYIICNMSIIYKNGMHYVYRTIFELICYSSNDNDVYFNNSTLSPFSENDTQTL